MTTLPPIPGIAAAILVCSLASGPSAADPSTELVLELLPTPIAALPPVPLGTEYTTQLVLDDGQAEGVYGMLGPGARQFLWFNRFATPSTSFQLQQIWVLFPGGGDVPVGGAVQLLVYLDPDGDPGNGADLLASYDGTVQVADGATFSIYDISPALNVTGEADLLIGVVNRYFEAGTTPPPTLPAALDTSSDLGRSYVAVWSGDPPDPPVDLPGALFVDPMDGAEAGSWMIRGFGSGPPVVEVPALGATSAFLLASLLAGLGVAFVRRG